MSFSQFPPNQVIFLLFIGPANSVWHAFVCIIIIILLLLLFLVVIIISSLLYYIKAKGFEVKFDNNLWFWSKVYSCFTTNSLTLPTSNMWLWALGSSSHLSFSTTTSFSSPINPIPLFCLCPTSPSSFILYGFFGRETRYSHNRLLFYSHFKHLYSIKTKSL